MFDKQLFIQGFPAHLSVSGSPTKSELTLTMQPFASTFHAPKGKLSIVSERGQAKPSYENSMSLTSSTFIGAEATAFLAAAQAASFQMMQWEALSRSLADASDAAYAITRLAEEKRWYEVALHIALLPDPLAELSPRCNYNYRSKKATNIAAALMRHSAFAVVKDTFLRDLNRSDEVAPADSDTGMMISIMYTLLQRMAMCSNMRSNDRDAMRVAILLLERDDVSGYTKALAKYEPYFGTPKTPKEGEVDTTPQIVALCTSDDALTMAELYTLLSDARPTFDPGTGSWS